MGTFLFRTILKLFKWRLENSSKYRRLIYDEENGYIFNARILFKTENDEEAFHIIFNDGKVTINKGSLEDPTANLIFKDSKDLGKLYRTSSNDQMVMLLKNKFRYKGNMSDILRFSFLTGRVLQSTRKKFMKRYKKKAKNTDDILVSYAEFLRMENLGENGKPKKNKILGYKVDKVKYLDDPYLGKYSIDDFKRLNYLKYRHFNVKGTVSSERAVHLTEYFKKYGFLKEDGNEDTPGLRQGKALKYLLDNKTPIIHNWDLIAGTTTTKEKGVLLFPETGAVAIWPEIYTVDDRELNPYEIIPEEADQLCYEVFPFWANRNIREYCRKMTDNPLSQQLDEVWVLYFMWKTQTISHTIPGFPEVLKRGLLDIKREAEQKEKHTKNQEKKDYYKGMQFALEGVINYAHNLSEKAKEMANDIDDSLSDPLVKQRKKELLKLARICKKVPMKPADTFAEAINSIWITWVCLHQESMNAGLSLGRLDQWLQPYFEKEMQATNSQEKRQEKIEKIIELMGCFYLRAVDHLPLVPDVGNYLFGGSSSDQALTVGGVDENGENAVNDMTYIILKVTEMLTLRDPNVNARCHPEINSREYLDRLCEVNINTSATPSIHNDKQMIKALVNQGIDLEDARTWAATGCVEPTICGKHFGHTNCMLLNTVAAMEMVLNNGIHPVVSELWQLGPETGHLNNFGSYDEFLNAYKKQLHFLVDNSVEYNNNLGKTHQKLKPTPFLSSLIKGPKEKGKDLVDGAAIYNSSGVALVGLTDVIDSLKVVKKLVYDKQVIDLPTLNDIIKNNFKGELGEEIYKMINKIPKFGSDNPESKEIGQDLVNFLYEDFLSYENYRGGKYMVGFWSMSNHVAFGTLSGALPSGRKANKPYTPGLTPAPGKKDELIQNIHSVAALDALKMPNNLAFNIKLIPNGLDTHEETLNYFNSYVKSYFDLGGMQMQFNVVSSDVLRDAMNHPENYGWLIVRISGYNAYFVDLNKDMQLELIERTEYATH
ncbi:MAG: formate acetyltransferase [Promethearchaeota archaeon]|nr:MAG: formate acetyltransferase [Candidatus Lokiarchaeota archaeon]